MVANPAPANPPQGLPSPRTIVVFGAGGRLGQHVVAHALRRNHRVHAVIHRNNPLTPHPLLTTRTVDIHHAAEVRDVLEPAHVVISCLGSAAATPPDIQTVAASTLTTGMQALGLRRLISVTGSGAQLPNETLTPDHRTKRWQMRLGAPHLLADGDAHLARLTDSDLQWTAIRVPFMTAPTKHGYHLQHEAPNPAGTVSYDNAATAMLNLATTKPAWVGAAPFLLAT